MPNLSIAYRAEDDPTRGRLPFDPPVIVHCPRKGCTFAATARRESVAVQAIVTHVVIVHVAQGQGAA